MTNEHDQKTAAAFATSWNNLPGGSVYDFEQFVDWLAPLNQKDVVGKSVLELGCGNGSLMVHMCSWNPSRLVGVDLGDSVDSCRQNLSTTDLENHSVVRGDLVDFNEGDFDVVYSIGVLHHLKIPKSGFDSVVKNTKSGGRFHCWVYAKEGNGLVIAIVEPIRKIASKFPWWVTKYLIATPMAVPFFVYGKLIGVVSSLSRFKSYLPLYSYMRWIGPKSFSFYRHVAFDQLVTPQTVFISKDEIESWLLSSNSISQKSTYCVFRNGNSWKFGGRKI